MLLTARRRSQVSDSLELYGSELVESKDFAAMDSVPGGFRLCYCGHRWLGIGRPQCAIGRVSRVAGSIRNNPRNGTSKYTLYPSRLLRKSARSASISQSIIGEREDEIGLSPLLILTLYYFVFFVGLKAKLARPGGQVVQEKLGRELC